MAKEIIRRLFDEVLNGGKLAALNDLISADYVDHTPAPGQGPGVTGVISKIQALRQTFLDIHFDLEAMVAEGDLVAVRYHWRGIQDGKRVRVRGMDFYRIKDGKIAEHWDTIGY